MMEMEELYPESPYTKGLGEFIKWCPYLTMHQPCIEEEDGQKYIVGYVCKVFFAFQRKDKLVGYNNKFFELHSVHEAQVFIAEIVKLEFHFYLEVTEFEDEDEG